jgi:hypothetical protein
MRFGAIADLDILLHASWAIPTLSHFSHIYSFPRPYLHNQLSASFSFHITHVRNTHLSLTQGHELKGQRYTTTMLFREMLT